MSQVPRFPNYKPLIKTNISATIQLKPLHSSFIYNDQIRWATACDQMQVHTTSKMCKEEKATRDKKAISDNVSKAK